MRSERDDGVVIVNPLTNQTRELAITVKGISSSFGVLENKEKQKMLFFYDHIDESGDPTILKVGTELYSYIVTSFDCRMGPIEKAKARDDSVISLAFL